MLETLVGIIVLLLTAIVRIAWTMSNKLTEVETTMHSMCRSMDGQKDRIAQVERRVREIEMGARQS